MENNNKTMNKTMADILESQVKLIKGLEIVKCRELSSHYKVILSYRGENSKESKLDKMCAVGKEIPFVRFFIETAITGLLLKNDNMIEAKKWLNHEVWDNVVENADKKKLNELIKKSNLTIEEIEELVRLYNTVK